MIITALWRSPHEQSAQHVSRSLQAGLKHHHSFFRNPHEMIQGLFPNAYNRRVPPIATAMHLKLIKSCE